MAFSCILTQYIQIIVKRIKCIEIKFASVDRNKKNEKFLNLSFKSNVSETFIFRLKLTGPDTPFQSKYYACQIIFIDTMTRRVVKMMW